MLTASRVVAMSTTLTCFEKHQGSLWGLAYRMTGVAADADDILQDAWLRFSQKPPCDLNRSIGPWLVRVTVNLSLDALRRRRRQEYVGPWLPGPAQSWTDNLDAIPFAGADWSAQEELQERTPAGRYELLESVSFAFMLALEVLTPRMRAVLLLRDVFDYSCKETAQALEMSDSNVKTTLHRARRQMIQYDGKRNALVKQTGAQQKSSLEKFLQFLAAGNLKELEKLLVQDVQYTNDSDGQFFAARKTIVGAGKVVQFFRKVASLRPHPQLKRWLRLCSGPALFAEWKYSEEQYPPRSLLCCELDEAGRISALYSVTASDKISRAITAQAFQFLRPSEARQ